MKFLLFLVVVGVLAGCRSRSFRWREVGIIALVVGLLVSWQTFNIMFRYIGVE